jgi:hypothetical protein
MVPAWQMSSASRMAGLAQVGAIEGGHAVRDVEHAFGAAGAVVQQVGGPGVDLAARDGVPGAQLPAAEIHLGQARVEAQAGRAQAPRELGAALQRAGDDGQRAGQAGRAQAACTRASSARRREVAGAVAQAGATSGCGWRTRCSFTAQDQAPWPSVASTPM